MITKSLPWPMIISKSPLAMRVYNYLRQHSCRLTSQVHVLVKILLVVVLLCSSVNYSVHRSGLLL